MAWALVNPQGIGDYFPSGDYVGRKEQLDHYYENEMSDAQKKEMGIEEKISYHEFGKKYFSDLGPLAPGEMPQHFGVFKNYKTLGSLIQLNYRLHAVDETLKSIITRLEPDVHQFWPIRITLPKGQDYPVPYYGMVIRRFLNSFVVEKSAPGSWRKLGGGDHRVLYVPYSANKACCAGLALSQAAIGDAHLWRETMLDPGPNIFFSDTLQAEIKSAGLRITRHYKLKDV